jgi:hypothetical protein
MGSFEALVLVLLGMAVGAAVPALLQLRRTLKSAERFLDETGPRLQRTLETADRAAARVDRIADGLETELERARGFLDAAADFGRSLRQMQGTLRTVASVGAAIGPAVAAAARALFDPFRSAERVAGAATRGDGGASGRGDDAESTAAPAPRQGFPTPHPPGPKEVPHE